jgi:tRNA threonylcarbamoyladenosine biosynthesis protein TsaB
MLVLAIRTDKPEAEIYLIKSSEQISSFRWEAHRTLSETLLEQIKTLLVEDDKDFKHITGIICFGGPGSFTGLRIGLTVANALAHSLKIPIVKSDSQDWLEIGLRRLKKSEDDKIAIPDYGAEPHITPQIH